MLPDNEFAAKLRASGWSGVTHTVGNSVNYLTDSKQVIAIAFYNNEKSQVTRIAWMKGFPKQTRGAK